MTASDTPAAGEGLSAEPGHAGASLVAGHLIQGEGETDAAWVERLRAFFSPSQAGEGGLREALEPRPYYDRHGDTITLKCKDARQASRVFNALTAALSAPQPGVTGGELAADLRRRADACRDTRLNRAKDPSDIARLWGKEAAYAHAAELLAASPSPAALAEPGSAQSAACPKDGGACYVGGDEPHWRCGTSSCGRKNATAFTQPGKPDSGGEWL